MFPYVCVNVKEGTAGFEIKSKNKRLIKDTWCTNASIYSIPEDPWRRRCQGFEQPGCVLCFFLDFPHWCQCGIESSNGWVTWIKQQTLFILLVLNKGTQTLLWPSEMEMHDEARSLWTGNLFAVHERQQETLRLQKTTEYSEVSQTRQRKRNGKKTPTLWVFWSSALGRIFTCIKLRSALFCALKLKLPEQFLLGFSQKVYLYWNWGIKKII